MRVGVVGAGAVGGYIAIALSAGGADVVLLGRRRLDDPADMLLVRRDGSSLRAGAGLAVTRDVDRLSACSVVLVTVKAQDTDTVARTLTAVLDRATSVVSFQNGIDNLARLRAHLSGPVLGGVVGFNIACEGAARRELTRGTLRGERSATLRALAAPLRNAGVKLVLDRDIEARIAGKLLINLVNGVAGATGLGTAALLASADARYCAAQCIREGLSVMRAAGMRPATVTVVSPDMLARALLLPGWILTPFVRAIVDPGARASTLQDLEQEKPTEIFELNGAVVRLAERAGSDAPINRLITQIVERHAQQGFVTPAELRARIAQSTSRKGRTCVSSTSRTTSS